MHCTEGLRMQCIEGLRMHCILGRIKRGCKAISAPYDSLYAGVRLSHGRDVLYDGYSLITDKTAQQPGFAPPLNSAQCIEGLRMRCIEGLRMRWVV